MRPIVLLLCAFCTAGMSCCLSSHGPLPRPFSGLHWHMKRAEVEAQYPALHPIDRARGPGLEGFDYAGCRFEVIFEFQNGDLDAVTMDADEDSTVSCYATIKRNLGIAFGKPEEREVRGGEEEISWRNDDSFVRFRGGPDSMRIELSPDCKPSGCPESFYTNPP